MKASILIIAVAAAALAAPAAASASTLAYEGDLLVYRAAPGEQNFANLSTEEGRFVLGDSGAPQMSFPGDRCTRISEEYPVHCDMPAKVRIELGDAADNGFVRGVAPELPIEIFGGDGNDQLKGADAATVALHGEAGDDKLESEDAGATLTGGPGRDELLGGGGSDRLQGGDGDDYLRPDTNSAVPGDDLVDGGPGVDLVEDWVDNASSGTQRTVEVTLDGKANDGRPREADDVRDVEHIRTFVAGRWVMGDGPDRVESWAPVDYGPSVIEGRGGDDVLLSGNGTQTLDGGAGDDRLEAGFGNDTITGGPGRDTIHADFTGSQCGVFQSCTVPHGDDIVLARDGEADTIACGVGNDRAVVDAIDTVSDCEQVEASGRVPTGGGSTGSGSTGTARPGGDAPGAGATLTVSRRALGLALHRGLLVRLTGARPGPLSIRAVRGGRTVARARTTVDAAGNARATLRFAAAARRSLARRRSVRLTIIAGEARRTVTLGRVAAAASAAAATVDLPRLFARQIERIEARTTVPVLLPETFDHDGARLYASGGASRGGWDLELASARGCGGATACFVASFTAQRGERPHFRTRVRLVGGRTGYFKPLSCGASCSPPMIEWRRGRVLYAIQAHVGTAETELDELVRLANSAIAAGPR